MKKHDSRCENAHSKKCRCSCNGRLHGRESGIMAEGKQFDVIFKVGEVVRILHGWKKELTGKLAFVDEVVSLPSYPFNQWGSGTFSLTGFEAVQFSWGKPSFYYGDNKGYEIETTGRFVKDEELDRLLKEQPENKGLAKDVLFVKQNRGKTMNQGRGLIEE